MSLIWRIATLRTLSFAIGVVLGIVGTAYAQSAVDGQGFHHPPGPRLALDRWLIVAGHRRQPTAVEIDRATREQGIATSAPHSRDKDGEVQLLYDEILRQTDNMLILRRLFPE
jgi:hypothetical protein